MNSTIFDLDKSDDLTMPMDCSSFADTAPPLEMDMDGSVHRRARTESECSSILDENEHIARLHADLKKYLDLLPHTVTSLNALLDAEHNASDEKALNLLRYYYERENLVEYTLEKELPRMNYTWIDETTGEFISDKQRIAVLLWEASLATADDPSKAILPRCANQSLLADLLQFLTLESDNALIRTQFHMAVDTRQVEITIMPSNKTVLVKATLGLSLPHPTLQQVNIAQVHISAQFSPLTPLFHYHVESIQVVQPCPDDDDLLEMAMFLQDLPSFVIEEEEPLDCSKTSKWDVRRDAFLQKTQSAWRQSSKLTRNLLHKMSSHNSSARTANSGGDSNNYSLKSHTVAETLDLPQHGALDAPALPLPATEESPAEPRLAPPIRPPAIQKSLRRIRDAQKASSKKIMSVFKKPPTQHHNAALNVSSEPPPPPLTPKKPTWGQVSSRLLSKPAKPQPPLPPTTAPPNKTQETWPGVLRSRWNRGSGASISSKSSWSPDSTGSMYSEVLVFDSPLSYDDSAPTEPPSDDEQTAANALSITVSLTQSCSLSSPANDIHLDLQSQVNSGSSNEGEKEVLFDSGGRSKSDSSVLSSQEVGSSQNDSTSSVNQDQNQATTKSCSSLATSQNDMVNLATLKLSSPAVTTPLKDHNGRCSGTGETLAGSGSTGRPRWQNPRRFLSKLIK